MNDEEKTAVIGLVIGIIIAVFVGYAVYQGANYHGNPIPQNATLFTSSSYSCWTQTFAYRQVNSTYGYSKGIKACWSR